MKDNRDLARRMKALEDEQLEKGYAYLKTLEKQLEKSQHELDRDLTAWYARTMTDEKITLADAKTPLTKTELKDYRWAAAEYLDVARSGDMDSGWIEQLEHARRKTQVTKLDSIEMAIRQQAETAYSEQLRGVEELLAEIYQDDQRETAAILKEFGFDKPAPVVDEDKLAEIIDRAWADDGLNYKDRCATNRNNLLESANKKLTDALIRGDDPEKAIAAITKEFQTAQTAADRLVMTEAAATAVAAQHDCFAEMGVVKYKIVEALGPKSCELCAQMNGQVFDMADFAVGVTAPPFHPWCGGTIAPADGEQQDEASIGGNQKLKNPDDVDDVVDIKKIVFTNGLRNDLPLTQEQYDELAKYAIEFGFPEEKIAPYNVDSTQNTGLLYGERLYINNDALPANTPTNDPNSLLSGRAAMAHEVIGHYETVQKGTAFETQYDDSDGVSRRDVFKQALDEAQASIRAGRFAPDLSMNERLNLLKDGLMRLSDQEVKIKDVRKLLDILER